MNIQVSPGAPVLSAIIPAPTAPIAPPISKGVDRKADCMEDEPALFRKRDNKLIVMKRK